MDTISATPTQAGWETALTLGPSNYRSVSAQIFNASVIAQLYEFGSGGDVGTGGWADEILLTPQSLSLDNCGGIRFKTNPKTPTLPGTVLAWASRKSDVGLSGSPIPADVQINADASTDILSIPVQVVHDSTPVDQYTSIIFGVANRRIQILGYRLQATLDTAGEVADVSFWHAAGPPNSHLSYLVRLTDQGGISDASLAQYIVAGPGFWERTSETGQGVSIGSSVSGGQLVVSGVILYRYIPAV